MKKIYIIHGWDGGPDKDWIGWATQVFREKGFEVIAPEMPNPEVPVLQDWVSTLQNVVQSPDQNTYLIGHSIGCQTIMRYLQNVTIKVGGAIFVAGWFNLINLENEESEQIAKPWLETPINTDAVRQNLGFSIVVLGDNDLFVPYQQTKSEFETRLGSEVVTISGAGHITSDEGFGPFPQLVEIFENAASKT